MTLLVATVSQEQVLLASDGLSIVESLNAPGRTTLRKVFPIPSRPIAIAQCGRNFLNTEARGEMSIGKAIAEWYDSELPQMARSVANCLEKWIREVDREYFTRSQSELWVAGYSVASCEPEFYRLTEKGVERRRHLQHAAGAGTEFLRGKNWSTHAEAWDIAMVGQKEQKRFVFGGCRHQLRITPTGWTWVENPTYGSLGVEGEILPLAGIPSGEKVADPRCSILSARDDLQAELRRRALKPNGKRPGTYGGAKEHWKANSYPDWSLTDRLIAVCDEARLAHPSDVSEHEALLYRIHIRQVIDLLPNPIDDP